LNAQFETPWRFVGWAVVGSLAFFCLVVAMAGSGAAQSSPPGRWLEFDVAGGANITGVVVGYFVPGQREPAFSFEVPRSKLESPRAGVLRVPLIVSKLPPGQSYEVRLRVLSRRQRSGWSESSGQFTVPDDGGAPASPIVATPVPASKRSPNQTAPRNAGGRSALNELKNNPELGAKLSKQFPGIDPTKAAEGFRTVRDLGVALFIASNLKVPFEDVKKLTADAGSRDFIKAIAKVKPDVDARAEEQRATRQSRQLMRAPAKSPK
jgi:hypothetical protein